MVFNTGAALLDAIVLAVVAKEPEGAYGYKITQDVRQIITVSESTLYPVLRRLQKDECLTIYDQECAGRNRRYYLVTEKGRQQLSMYREEWKSYSGKVNRFLREDPQMNRFEYMRRLEALLSDISPSEKEEALTYYNDYFNDAGQENEQQVIKELGSPEQVAAGVKEGLGLQSYEHEQDSLEGRGKVRTRVHRAKR